MKKILITLALLLASNMAYACDLSPIVTAKPNPVSGAINTTVACGSRFDGEYTETTYDGSKVMQFWMFTKGDNVWFVSQGVDIKTGLIAVNLEYRNLSCTKPRGANASSTIYYKTIPVVDTKREWSETMVNDPSFGAADDFCPQNAVQVPPAVKAKLLRATNDLIAIRQRIIQQQ